MKSATTSSLDPRAVQAALDRGFGRIQGSVEINQSRSPRARIVSAAMALGVGLAAVVVHQVSNEHVGKVEFLVMALQLLVPAGLVMLLGAWRQSRRGREHLFWCDNGMVWLAGRSGETRTFGYSTMSVTVSNRATAVNPRAGELRQEYLVVLKDDGPKAEIKVDDPQTLWAINQVMKRLDHGPLV